MKYKVCALVAGLLIVGLLQVPSAWADAQPRVLLITGNGNDKEHDYAYPAWNHEFFNDEIVQILEGLVQVRVSDDLSLLNDRDLAGFDLIVNNSMFLTPTQDQLDAFFRFIARGKSYLALHAGLASFLNSERYAQLIGGHFVNADNQKEFEVFTFDAWYGYDYNDQVQHPVTRGLPNFRIEDELYLLQANTAELEVIARAENHPVLWWRPWDKGKAMGLALGHGREAVQNPGYRKLLRNSVRWLVGYPILGTVREGIFPAGVGAVDHYLDLDDLIHSAGGALSYRIAENSNPELVRVGIDGENRINLVFVPGREGSAAIALQAQGANGLAAATDFKVSVRPKGSGNLARYHGVSALTSSNEVRKYTANPAAVLDGDPDSRWSSDYRDLNWITLDLGEAYRLNRVKLLWEGAYARSYEIQVSQDAELWSTVHRQEQGDGGTDEIAFDPVPARFVRLQGGERATRWGYSLYEFEVYGEGSD
jgi:type 1 glutamine amidotransferase